MRSEQRKDGWPEQEPVREAFRQYLNQFKSDKAAATKIGVTKQQVSDWKRGTGSIPEWFCEYLGYRKAYIPIGGPVGVTIA